MQLGTSGTELSSSGYWHDFIKYTIQQYIFLLRNAIISKRF